MHAHGNREGRSLRWWLHFGRNSTFHTEFYLFSGRFAMEVKIGGEAELLIVFAPVLFSLYLTLDCGWTRTLREFLLKDSWEPRAIGLRIFDWAIWLECWAPTGSWSSREPWWMRFTWHPLDTFFGRMKHSEREISRTDAVISMPEKAYPCTVVMKAETWKRPRLPWASAKVTRAHMECEEGVPVPGKGTTSYNCGDDAIYSMCCQAESVEQGIARYAEDAQKTRLRYGGKGWRAA